MQHSPPFIEGKLPVAGANAVTEADLWVGGVGEDGQQAE